MYNPFHYLFSDFNNFFFAKKIFLKCLEEFDEVVVKVFFQKNFTHFLFIL